MVTRYATEPFVYHSYEPEHRVSSGQKVSKKDIIISKAKPSYEQVGQVRRSDDAGVRICCRNGLAIQS